MPTAKPASRLSQRPRNRAATEAALCDAVLRVLAQGGFPAVTPSQVAAAAGVDKMLIYRYFGDLAGLVRATLARPGTFPDLAEAAGGDIAACLALPPPARARHVLAHFAAGLAARPALLAVMSWELVARDELTAIAEEARERQGAAVLAALFAEFAGDTRFRALATLFSAGLTYLVLRRQRIRLFNGFDLSEAASWSALLDAAASVLADPAPQGAIR